MVKPAHRPSRPGRRLLRWLTPGLETYIALPLFAVVLLALIWSFTLHVIGREQAAAQAAVRASAIEMADTYEAQMARNLNSIDQTLKVVKYATEQRGSLSALPTLNEKGLLPSGLVFVVSIADRDGNVVASNPPAQAINVGDESYFRFHRESDSDLPYVSQTMRDPANRDWHLHFTRRINDAAGRFAGIVIVEMDPAYFTSGYEHARMGARGVLGLHGNDGAYRTLRIGDKVSWGQVEPSVAPDEHMGQSSWDQEVRYTVVRRLHGFPLASVVALSVREQMERFEANRRNYLLAAGSGSVALLVLTGLVGLWSWQLSRSRGRTRRAQETYAAASEASSDAFFVMRNVTNDQDVVVDFMIEEINSRAESMLRQPKHAVQGKTLLGLWPACRDNGIFDDLVHVTIVGGVHEADWRNEDNRSAVQWLHRQVVPVEGGIVAIVRDITERKLTEERILHLAHHDELTGLPNRSLIRDRLDRSILHAQRKGRSVALAFIDLDGFKLVNDGLGHNAGDELLKIVGERMGQCIRRADTLGRFGGDEFVVILPDLPDNPLAITPVLENIRQAVAEPVLLDGQEVQVSASMGVVMYPRDGEDPTTLMMNADAAMYRAKDLGSNNFQFYTREMNASVEEKLVLLEGLRRALDEQEFKVMYQPRVDLRSGQIIGVEALVRWYHPEQGVVSPARFIPLAEESGLIVQIGEWVLRSACAQNQAWRDMGLPHITMSVNVSPRQFEERRLVERVALALRDSRLAASGLELEVTESLIMRDLQQSVERMADLQSMGVSLSIDDFGTGYSSLSALKSFPISSLKIDRSFVRDLGDSTDDQAIAMAVISLGHKLDLRVVAEGVETEFQRDFLKANDCDEMQGYLFSHPISAAEMGAMLERQAALSYAGAGAPGAETTAHALAS
jgi:diguanylate cyclase (GGDEF)-like protein